MLRPKRSTCRTARSSWSSLELGGPAQQRTDPLGWGGKAPPAQAQRILFVARF
jgi:hypothetical protein